jgi:hypothetical protein
VGLPVLALLGILEAGRNIRAPLSIAGDWTLEFDPAAGCANGPADLRQPALNISQSGSEALITLNDGHATSLEATVNGAVLKAGSLTASIAGKPAARTLAGAMNFAGCAPVPFRGVRQVSRKRDE